MRISLSIETLQAAYDICLLVKSHSGNVLAQEDSASDKEWYDKAKKFMDAFDKACKNNPDRKKYRGDWIKDLEKSLDNFSKAIDDLDGAVGGKV